MDIACQWWIDREVDYVHHLVEVPGNFPIVMICLLPDKI